MKDFKSKKSDFRMILESWPILFLLGFLIIFFIFNIFSFVLKMNDLKKEKNLAKEEVSDLKNKKDRLDFEIKNLNTEEGKERFIREKFGYAKPNEGLIVVVNDKSSILNEKENEKDYGFFSFILKWFK